VPRIFIVDDYAPFRRHLRELIESQDNWKVCCEASDGSEAISKYADHQPQLTVMDFNMPGLAGLKAAKKILANDPQASILMVTVFASEQLAREVQQAGIKGFCTKTEVDCIVTAIETVLDGGTYFPPHGSSGYSNPV
jgi:DNA-binding NarL/FixJ family response regulator